MALNYTRVNFQNGERLQASDLNHMDQQIELLTEYMDGVDTIFDNLIQQQAVLIERGAEV